MVRWLINCRLGLICKLGITLGADTAAPNLGKHIMEFPNKVYTLSVIIIWLHIYV